MATRNQDGFVFVLLHCFFSLKSHINGLKWNFWPSLVCRINNCYPTLFNFVVGQFWSKLESPLKYFSFCCLNFLKIVIFDKHVHTTCISNENRKHVEFICFFFWEKMKFLKFSLLIWQDLFFQNSKFSKFFLYNPQDSFPTLILNTQNENYMKVWQS